MIDFLYKERWLKINFKSLTLLKFVNANQVQADRAASAYLVGFKRHETLKQIFILATFPYFQSQWLASSQQVSLVKRSNQHREFAIMLVLFSEECNNIVRLDA